jgi:hypothetical protein
MRLEQLVEFSLLGTQIPLSAAIQLPRADLSLSTLNLKFLKIISGQLMCMDQPLMHTEMSSLRISGTFITQLMDLGSSLETLTQFAQGKIEVQAEPL